jgi:hypothetical protein
MRVSYTLLAVAAFLSLAACGTSSTEIVAPADTSSRATGTGERGLGWSGSGNAIATDSTTANTLTAERGLGWSGSGN